MPRSPFLPIMLLLSACGAPAEEAPPPAPIRQPPPGMPTLVRRPFALADADLPENRFMVFAVGSDGILAYTIGFEAEPKFRVVDSTGKRLAAFGRNGEGPGETELVSLLERRGDTLRVFEGNSGQLIDFRLDGSLIRSRRVTDFDIPLAWHADSVDHWNPLPLPSGSKVDHVVLRTAIGETGGRPLLRESEDEIFTAAILKRSNNAVLSFPFTASDDRYWVADPWDYRIRAYSSAGQRLFDINLDIPPNARGPRGNAMAREQIARSPKSMRGPNGQRITLPDESARLDTLDRERIRHFGRSPLHVDGYGRLWVVGYSRDSAAVDLFQDSVHVGRVMLPCFPTGYATMVSFAKTGWMAIECEIDDSDWPTEMQLYRIVEQP